MAARKDQTPRGVAGRQMLEAILSSAVGAIITIDQFGVVQTVNPATERMFGYTADELIGNNVNQLMPSPDRDNHDGYLRHHLTTGEERIIGIGRELEGQRKNGARFPMHLSVSAFEIEGVQYFAGIMHDLTERDQIKNELERQGSIFEAVFDNVPEALIVSDQDHNIVLCNAALSDVFGWKTRELSGSSISTIYETREEYERVGDLIATLTPGARLGPFLASYRRNDGSVFPGQSLGANIRTKAGEEIGFLTLIRNIEQELEQQKALGTAQRMEAVGQLTGGIAHDFNNLLTVITGNLELLDMRLEGEREQELLKRANDAALMGARLTGRLLTFARRRQFDAVRLNLNEQVVTMADLLRRTIGEHLHLSTMLDANLWDVHADPSEIENAILNLAINARDAMPSHGNLIIETANVEIDPEDQVGEASLPPGPYVRLSVSDTGTGMPPDIIERAFEPFFTTKAPGKGSGLGLSTIYGFARQLEGTVAITSEVGHGTTVSIYLPRASEGVQAAAESLANDEVPTGQNAHVLLVEDNSDVKQVTRQRLEQLGYRVTEANDGREAMDVLEARRDVDIVFSDIVMPGGISGIDLARWVQAHNGDMAILLASGFAADAIAAQGEDLPDVEILRKPYDRKELAQALRHALTK